MCIFRASATILCLSVALLFCPAVSAGTAAKSLVKPARVDEISRMLPEAPAGPGRPVTDRAAWKALGRNTAYKALRKEAKALLGRPLPAQPDDLYLDFSRTGNRKRFQKVANGRRKRLTPLVLAECVENRGRFLPAIEDLITTLCAERTWVLPAHDRELANFHRKQITIDLASSAVGWNLAMADHLLGPRLRPEVRRLLRESVEQRVLAPFRDMVHGQRAPDRWLRQRNNWNPVCLAGVVGAALIQIDSPAERAEFIAAAEKFSTYFLEGFSADGYCSEGLGYWNYGFGHYVLLSESIHHSTGGGIDLLSKPGVRAPATFASRIQIINGIAPAFADCYVGSKPLPELMWILNHRLKLGMEGYEELSWPSTLSTLPEAMLYVDAANEHASPSTPDAPSTTSTMSMPSTPAPQIRSWFDAAGILIGRPAPGSSCRIGVALKGGRNDEQHNHNDLGSYVVVSGKSPVLLDPGLETYTARTFSSRRYESRMLNSFGHPVPVVAGRLQESGGKARAKVLETEFSDKTDTLRLDLSSAYAVPDLEKLERTFVYSRVGDGSLSLSDSVEFRAQQSFETALITAGKYVRKDKDTLLITDSGEHLKVVIDTGKVPFELVDEVIREDAPVQPTRIGIRLREPVTSATVRLIITPQ